MRVLDWVCPNLVGLTSILSILVGLDVASMDTPSTIGGSATGLIVAMCDGRMGADCELTLPSAAGDLGAD